MSIPQAISLCFLPALSSDPATGDGRAAADSPGGDAAAAVEAGGIPALFTWADFDGDARLDFAAVTADGRLQLLVDDGQGRFEDVTERAGLAGVAHAALALWADYDVDGRLDLFVGSSEGASHLFHNEGGSFVDMTQGSGLLVEGPIQHAAWIDRDEDGRPDLHAITAEANELFRGLEGGFFERTELPRLVLAAGSLSSGTAAPRAPVPAEGSSLGTSATGGEGDRASLAGAAVGAPGTAGRRALLPSIGPATPLPFTLSCIDSIDDKAGSGCLAASSTPTLGRLYPLSTNLFVAVGGNVGIGTTSPGSRLEVAGTARITDTLTLAPAGDVALDVSTGSIYKGGALFIHTKGGSNNTALGRQALSSVTTGYNNTASGYRALFSNTAGSFNTANGYGALTSNTTGIDNTASGHRALYYNTTGLGNTASGASALFYNTTGFGNTASGSGALFYNRTGDHNTASGYRALSFNTIGDRNTASGSRALANNYTGFDNTASGYQALSSNNGSRNTASGSRALFSNTTGFDNTASGFQALYFNTTGFSNTASGVNALLFNTTGRNNTASGVSALSSNTTGFDNTASGFQALYSNTTGYANTASGYRTLFSNTTGFRNTASGYRTLSSNTTGYLNTASGDSVLVSNTTGSRNTASGYLALFSNTTGRYNTASGDSALFSNTTGSRNVALGVDAGVNLTTGNDNVAIANGGTAGESGTIRIGTAGTQTRAFVAGIRGVTTGVANAIPVLIDGNGQLGTVSSSARFKEEIRDMGELTDRLLELRPVVFRYKPEVQAGERPLEYGLIAEEVAEVFPELVVYDDEGKPFTVKYHLLSAMLLNELEKLRDRHDRELEEHATELAELRGEVAELFELVRPEAAVASPRPAEPARARSGESP